MSPKYIAKYIEEQAQEYWRINNSFKVKEDKTKTKFYCLSMFPYPSGHLHMGHVRNYSIGDVIARYQKMQGKNVMQPMGWDAFGLPAENAALENNIAPAKWILKNINYMKKQFIKLGFAYDWSREIATCNPKYYKWEQWLFTKLFKKGLVYKKNAIVNWDPVDKTVLANEQVINGYGWRSGALIEKKEKSQWFIKITDYAEELLSGLDKLDDWPDAVKTMQKNWIGKSVGLNITFIVENNDPLVVYTTRPDTLMGVTCLVIAPKHPLTLKASSYNNKIKDFIIKYSNIDTTEATIQTMDKAGINSGLYCTHPLSNKKIPIWIANFVLMSYGTGAVMSVPAHDLRDYDFAKKYNIPIISVIRPKNNEKPPKNAAFIEKGILYNSAEFNNLDFEQASAAITKILIKKGLGSKKTNYRLHDWSVSRQRYWGCPIPIINCTRCGTIPVPKKDLPVVLPTKVVFNSTNSPITKMPSFYKTTCPKCQGSARRETDTFDTFFESSWYFARYACARNNKVMLDDKANYWLEVDQYIGGIEHAILHLLYARFFNKLLRDEGLIKFDEPFKKLLTQGMILRNGHKMSKSKGNVIDPQDIIDKYGADTVRLFILFAAPPTQEFEWSYSGLEGSFRFINKIYRLVFAFINDSKTHKIAILNTTTLNKQQKNIRKKTHSTLKKISNDIAKRYSFNTAIATIMELSNTLAKFIDTSAQSMAVRHEAFVIILKTLSPIAPHISHYLWGEIGHKNAIINEHWPEVDDNALKTEEIQVIVQVNGRLRGKIQLSANCDNQTIKKTALKNANVAKFIANKNIIKTIIVPKKLINIVVK